MTFVKHFSCKGWDMDVEVYPGPAKKGEPPGGCVLRNLRHDEYNLAQDMRVCRVWVGDQPPHREDKSSLKGLKSFMLGSPAMPLIGGPTFKDGNDKDSMAKLIAPHLDAGRIRTEYTLDDPNNPGFGDPDYGRVDFTQTYVLTNYTDSPAHEPGHVLTAARVYPLFKFRAPERLPDRKPVRYLRVDYRVEFNLDQGLNKSANEKRLAEGGPFNQAGIFLDFDSVTVIPILRIRDVFEAAEKPLKYEVIGKGMEFGRRADWDNLHVWGKALTGMDVLPSTPGAFHAAHTHWRWGADVVEPGPAQRAILGLKGGQQFGPLGKGIPIVDPKIFNQNLRFAVAAMALPGPFPGPGDSSDPRWKAAANGSTQFFEDLFESARSTPMKIEDGCQLAVWFCLEAFREDDTKPWGGTFFVHGIYFGHGPDKTNFLGDVAGGLKESLHKPAPTRTWERPLRGSGAPRARKTPL